MNKLDDDIRRALANGEASYDVDREEGLFRQCHTRHGGVRRLSGPDRAGGD